MLLIWTGLKFCRLEMSQYFKYTTRQTTILSPDPVVGQNRFYGSIIVWEPALYSASWLCTNHSLSKHLS